MIRSKQMEEIRGLDKRLRSLGVAPVPNLEKHVMLALVSGEKPKLKTPAEISSAARRKMVAGRYSSDRNLSFADVFASCNGYKGDFKIYEAHEKNRRACLVRYERAAEKILVKAMDADAEAPEVVEQLHEAADASGLTKITLPVYSDTEKSVQNDD